MKKLFLLMISAAVAVSASAALFTHPLTDEMKNRDVITEQPAGELKTYTRSGLYNFVYEDGYIGYIDQTDMTMDIVYAEGGKVYLKNIICDFDESYGDSWVEGQLSEDGTQITVPLGQPLYYSSYNDANIIIGFGEPYVKYGYYMFSLDVDVTEAVYVIDGGTITLQGDFTFDEDKQYGYGFGAYWDDDFSWSGYSEYNTVLTDDNYVPPTPPVDPEVKTGAPTFQGFTEDGIHGYFVEIIPTEESVIYYRIIYPDGTVTEWAEYEEILSFEGDGKYRVEAYAVADGKLPSEEIAYEFVVAPITGVEEMMSGKEVAGVRYFNLAGQEMREANGLTIVVTTYTDGTTSAVKVVK